VPGCAHAFHCDLTRPICVIEGGEVTGRALEMGTTTLLVDLMRRVDRREQMNYELNIGARRFKCTTIPIVRSGYGVVGAICSNIEINYVRDEVLKSVENTAAFRARYCQTDVRLDEKVAAGSGAE
jgi:predicted transcriptional regulator YheO